MDTIEIIPVLKEKNWEELQRLFNIGQLAEIKESPEKNDRDHVLFNFISGGPKVELHGYSGDTYSVQFIDKSTDKLFCQGEIRSGQYIQASPEYYVTWRMIVTNLTKGVVINDFTLDLTGKNVLIAYESSALGDTIAWAHVIESFQKKWGCNIVCASFHNAYLAPIYPSINWIDRTRPVQGVHVLYRLGWFGSGHKSWKNPGDCHSVPMEKIASDILGIEHKEGRNFLQKDDRKPLINGKYIVMTDSSTAQFKYWNLAGGWQSLIDWYARRNIQIVNIGKMPNHYQKVINMTGERTINDLINILQYSEYFIGLGSGLSWLNHYLKDLQGNPKKTVIISGMSQDWCEFQEDCYRLINKTVCHGCFNDSTKVFDKGNWLYCEKSENFAEKFECSKNITVEHVKTACLELESDLKDKKYNTPIKIYPKTQ